MKKTKKLTRVGSFSSEARRSCQVPLAQFADDVEVAIKVVVAKAVRDFFTPSKQESPVAMPLRPKSPVAVAQQSEPELIWNLVQELMRAKKAATVSTPPQPDSPFARSPQPESTVATSRLGESVPGEFLKHDAAFLLRLEETISRNPNMSDAWKRSTSELVRKLMQELLRTESREREGATVTASPQPESRAGVQPVVPEGFTRLGIVSDAPWFALVNGNKMVGRLLGKYGQPDVRSKTGTSYFYQVELSSPTTARFGRGEKAKFATATPGQVVNLNSSNSLAMLDDVAADVAKGVHHDVSIECLDKVPLADGNMIWRMVVSVKKV